MDTYTATVTREDNVWLVDIDGPERGVTQACYPGEVEAMARDWIETMTGRDDFTVATVDLTGDIARWAQRPGWYRWTAAGWHATRCRAYHRWVRLTS